MKNLIYIFVLVIGLSSCSEYQKALKNEDVAAKFKLGEELYNKGKYNKASKLFAQIVPKYRGKPQAEKLMFLYSDTFFKMEDYYLSGYQFEIFEDAYPKSQKIQEAAYLAAKSHYMLSPVYSKDQTDTKKALDKLQLFINNYPDSEYLPEANTLIQELDSKLEKKAYETAKQYNRISDFQASMKAFDNFIIDFPGTKFREEALFYRFDSAYKLALNSVEWKKEQRLKDAEDYYLKYKNGYPTSQFSEEAESMELELKEELLKFSNTKS